MAITLNPYLSFDGSAREAMTFYQSVFGGELSLSTFGESGGNGDPAQDDLIMHGELTGEGIRLMGSDMVPAGKREAAGYSVSLSGSEPALEGWWDKLATDGTVSQPLVEAPWGDRFGMCVDKFGTPWMVSISKPS